MDQAGLARFRRSAGHGTQSWISDQQNFRRNRKAGFIERWNVPKVLCTRQAVIGYNDQNSEKKM
jgi:hypothetical protein